MARHLPPHSSLTHLKHQAKDLLKAYRSQDGDATGLVHALLPRLSQSSAPHDPSVTLQEVQHVLAMDYGFENWASLAAYHQQVEKTERFERHVPFETDGTVSVSTVCGDITVEAWDRPEIAIHATKRAKAGPESEAERQLKAIEILVTESPGKIEIAEKLPEMKGYKRMGVEFTVSIPSGAQVALSSVNGEIAASGTWTRVDMETINGDVEARGEPGTANLKTFNGNVLVELASLSGDSAIETFNGNIEVRVLESVGVDVQLDTGPGGTVKNRVGGLDLRGNGSVTTGRLNGGGPVLSVRTTNGAVTLERRT